MRYLLSLPVRVFCSVAQISLPSTIDVSFACQRTCSAVSFPHITSSGQPSEIKGTCAETCSIFCVLVRENFIGKELGDTEWVSRFVVLDGTVLRVPATGFREFRTRRARRLLHLLLGKKGASRRSLLVACMAGFRSRLWRDKRQISWAKVSREMRMMSYFK